VAEGTQFDDVKNAQNKQLVLANAEAEEAAFNLQVQHILTRAPPGGMTDDQFFASHPELSINKTQNCRPVGAFSTPPCRIIQDVQEKATLDTHLAGREYYELFTPEMRSGRGAPQPSLHKRMCSLDKEYVLLL